MHLHGDPGINVAYTFCLWEGLLEEAESIAEKLRDEHLSEAGLSEAMVREYCRMKYRAAVALSIGLASLECLINEYLQQRFTKPMPSNSPVGRYLRASLEEKVVSACKGLLKSVDERRIFRKLRTDVLPMRDFLLELRTIPYNFHLEALTARGGKPLIGPARSFSNLNRRFILDALHTIRSMADSLSSSRLGIPKPMVFVHFERNLAGT